MVLFLHLHRPHNSLNRIYKWVTFLRSHMQFRSWSSLFSDGESLPRFGKTCAIPLFYLLIAKLKEFRVVWVHAETWRLAQRGDALNITWKRMGWNACSAEREINLSCHGWSIRVHVRNVEMEEWMKNVTE